MKWVEKSSIEKIRRLLEISERERHYRVLLTRKIMSAVRHNPAPYTLPVVLRPLPLNIVEGKHFVLKDVRRLAFDSVSSSRDLVVGAPSRVQGTRSASSTTLGRGSDLPPASDWGTRGQHPECLLTMAPTVRAAPRVVKVQRRRVSGASGERAITISGSPKLGQTGESGPDGAIQPQSGVGDPTPIALQVILPSDRGEKRTSKSQFMRSGLPKPTHPIEVLTLNYTPPCGPEPPRVEVTTPGMEEVKGILHSWEPFHREASLADRLNNLYSYIYRVPIVSRGMGLHEDCLVNLPTSTPK